MVVITIGLDLLLIPRRGVIGAALAAGISMVLVNIIRLLEIWYLLGMQPYNKSMLKPLFAALATGGVTFYLNHLFSFQPLLQLTLGNILLWGTYAIVLFSLGLAEEDLMLVKQTRAKIFRSRNSIR